MPKIGQGAFSKFLPSLIFTIVVGGISVSWIKDTSQEGILLPICFALVFISARFLAHNKKKRYLYVIAGICVIVVGQIFCPLDYYAFSHVVFNVPFISAYLLPSLWPGVLIGGVLGFLFFLTAVHEHLPFYVFGGPAIGAFLLPVLCHFISYLIHRLIADRNSYRKLSEELRLEIELEYKEKEKVKQELYKLDRLNLIGEMAASIGHEVRNPLTTVRGYLQFYQNKGGLLPPHVSQLMIGELDRANFIITEFLTLAKNKRRDLRIMNLNQILLSLKPMLEADALRRSHDIYFDLQDTPNIPMDENEIKQLIINLVQNAFEAMDYPSKVEVRTSSSPDSIVLLIRDFGAGIPEEVMTKLGTPFFTTKENGTGLGLAISYRIAERHKAAINFQSFNKGTTVTICFQLENHRVQEESSSPIDNEPRYKVVGN